MKTRLTLSTVVVAMLLTPAAFANGAQEQKPETAVANTASATVTVFHVAAHSEAATVTRSVLARMQQEVREQVLGNLRASGILADVLQIATPALVEAAAGQKSLTAL